MQRIRMGSLSELLPGKVIEKRILAKRVAVFNENGTLYGLESECKHMKASLAKGGVDQGILTCNWHGWKYDLRTGECLTQPGMRLKRYDIEVEGDQVFLILK
ncbi:MAG: Rieske (2Fe-2S) protein [Candidatus Zixiibacteriota bacterium]